MTSLYLLTGQYLQLANTLADGDFDPTTIADTIEASGITDEIAVKAQGIEYVARGAEAHNAAIDAEIARLQALKASRQKIAQGLRDYLQTSMEAMGIEKIECPMFKIALKKNPPSVEVLDESEIPPAYWRTPEPKPPVAAPDKKLILERLKAGEDVPGARIKQGKRLAIA